MSRHADALVEHLCAFRVAKSRKRSQFFMSKLLVEFTKITQTDIFFFICHPWRNSGRADGFTRSAIGLASVGNTRDSGMRGRNDFTSREGGIEEKRTGNYSIYTAFVVEQIYSISIRYIQYLFDIYENLHNNQTLRRVI